LKQAKKVAGKALQGAAVGALEGAAKAVADAAGIDQRSSGSRKER
jgi:hypothetical protein